MARAATAARSLDRWVVVTARKERPHMRYHGHTVGPPTTMSNKAMPSARMTSSLWAFTTSQRQLSTAPAPQTYWATVIMVAWLTGMSMAWSRWAKNTPNATAGVDSTFNSVGTCNALGPSHVQPSPTMAVTATRTTTGTRTASARTRQRLVP